MERGSNLKVKIKLTHFVMEVPMMTVFPEKNFTCFIFSNKFLLTILLIFILSSGYDVLLSSASGRVNLSPLLSRVRDVC